MNQQQRERIRTLAADDGARIADDDQRYGNHLTLSELRTAAELAAERVTDLRFADEPNRYNREDLTAVPFAELERVYVPAWMRGYRARRN